MLFGRDSRIQYTRNMALIGSVLSLAATLPVLFGFDGHTAQMQFEEQHSWIEAFKIYYHLGVDGISLWFVVLTPLMTLLVILGTWDRVQTKVAQYYALFLILCGIMVGLFCAQDGLLFYIFFEASLIPIYLITGIWGGPDRARAAIKFFLYTLLGSLLTLVALVYLYNQSHSFQIADWYGLDLPVNPQIYLFLAFFAAYAIKVPVWPLHSWLPDAYREAPTAGTVMMSALMVKMGAYGFLRFSLPITPLASHELTGLMLALSLIGLIYLSLVAIAQTDMKRVIAYASAAHMGLVMAGIFLFNETGLLGSVTQMVSHAMVAGALLLTAGMLFDRFKTYEISQYGGIAKAMPKLATFFVLFSLANTGLPGTSGFVGEFMVIMGGVGYNFWIGLVLAFSIILSAGYSLWLVTRVIFGRADQGVLASAPKTATLDLRWNEFLTLAILAVLIIGMGVYPSIVTDPIQASLQNLLAHAGQL